MTAAIHLPRQGNALHELNRDLEALSLPDFLAWSIETFGEHIAHVTSLGPSGLVILDHLMRLKPTLRVITLDTDFLFPETYALAAEVERRYGLQLEVIRPELTPDEQASRYGARLWELEPDVCCDLRKVRPMARALAGLEAWYTGIRRDQGPTRAQQPLVAWDTRFGLFKLSPLALWTRAQVWAYIRNEGIPYNALHDAGYTSIGCTHCTRVSVDASDERSGRWAGLNKTECGLHWAQDRIQRGGCPS